jgi:hypothetical protein
LEKGLAYYSADVVDVNSEAAGLARGVDLIKLPFGRKVPDEFLTFEFQTNFHRKAADKCVHR